VLALLFEPSRLRRIGRIWLVAAFLAVAIHLLHETSVGLTDGNGHPFGDDALNFWSAARLAFQGHAAMAYDLAAFHGFQLAEVGADLQLYHDSYPPVLMLLTWPVGALPYPVFWAFWLFGGWLFFALCIRRLLPRDWGLYAAATPAIMVDFIGGQVACWIAAIFGWALHCLPRRPALAGAIFSLAIIKPQLVWLVPFALVSGRQWRALGGFIGGCVILLGATTLAFGPDIWLAYERQAKLLQQVILENGVGVWHRMISVFVLARHLGASTTVAYAMQAVVSLGAAMLVVAVWRSPRPQMAKNAILVLGAIFASPYVSDYDLVMTSFVPLWLLGETVRNDQTRPRIAMVLLAFAPIAAAPIAVASGLAAGGALLLSALRYSARQPV
jgi:Glycosyltransferase family 87